MIEPTFAHPDAATTIFNLPHYRVVDTEVIAFGQRRISFEATVEAGCRLAALSAPALIHSGPNVCATSLSLTQSKRC